MDTITRDRLLERKDKFSQMVIDRVKRDFNMDIALIGITGSFSTNDFHEKSDIDLILINDSDQAWGIASCFILEEVGYDIYCSPWATRIEPASKLETPYISHLVDLEILHVRDHESLERFNKLRNHAKKLLAKPADIESLRRGERYLSRAKEFYTEMLLTDRESRVKFLASQLALEVINALVAMNNTYMEKGIKRYLDKIKTLKYKPDQFLEDYLQLIATSGLEQIRHQAFKLLASVNACFLERQTAWKIPLEPTADGMEGTYEELFCNYKNKISNSILENDISYAYLATAGAQAFLDEMVDECGAKEYDLMKAFDSKDLPVLASEFISILSLYQDHYESLGGRVKKYETFDELYTDFMKVPSE